MHPAQTSLYFGDFQFNRETGELFRGDARIRMQEKPLQVLALLIERAGQLVTRDELRHHLWAADTYVDFDRNLNTAVKKLRIALGDSADEPRYVETIPRRGYRLIMPVSSEAPHAHRGVNVALAEPTLDSPTPAPLLAGGASWRWLSRTAAIASVTAAIVLAFALGGIWKLPMAGPPPVLAVMPIKHNPPQHSFSEGVAKGLVRSLQSADSGVRVVGSRFLGSFRCSGNPFAEMAKELGVTHVVNGSVDRGPNGVLLTVRLIRASDQFLVASEAIQIEVAELETAETSAVERMTRMVKRSLL